MPCSNAAKTQNPLKFVGVPQTPEPISNFRPLRLGEEKKEEEEERRRRKKKQDENIMVCPITKGDHKESDTNESETQ